MKKNSLELIRTCPTCKLNGVNTSQVTEDVLNRRLQIPGWNSDEYTMLDITLFILIENN